MVKNFWDGYRKWKLFLNIYKYQIKKKVKLIHIKLSERPLLWWTQNKQMRQKMGKEPITSREKMKRKI